MYAEDKRFFPDDTMPSMDAVDALWSTYADKAQMGDETFWGPRPRLRCEKMGRQVSTPYLVKPSEALRCMERVSSADPVQGEPLSPHSAPASLSLAEPLVTSVGKERVEQWVSSRGCSFPGFLSNALLPGAPSIDANSSALRRRGCSPTTASHH